MLLRLGAIAHAKKNMSQVALDAGLSRERLYKTLSDNSNPSLAIALKVAKVPGVQLHPEAI